MLKNLHIFNQNYDNFKDFFFYFHLKEFNSSKNRLKTGLTKRSSTCLSFISVFIKFGNKKAYIK